MAKYKFRVLAGRHIHEHKLYKQNEVVETDSDLGRFNSAGAVKFEKLSGPTEPVEQNASAVSFPGGQVHDGKQVTTSRADGSMITGPEAPAQPELTQETKDHHLRLDRMNLQELKNYAAEEEIDLKGATRREDVLRILKAT